MRNAFGSQPQWREDAYLHLLAGESGQRHRRLTSPNDSREKDSPSTKCQRPSRRMDEREEVRATSCP